MITLENKKVHDWIVAKDELVFEGRRISGTLENIEGKIKRLEEKEKKITSRVVPPKELTDKGDVITKQIAGLSDELDGILRKISDAKLEAIPKIIKDDHYTLMKEREKLERDRNKIALKVQKIKDKIVPLVQKEVSPLVRKERIVTINIGKYDDIETAKAKDGKVVISTFNHLEDWQKKFK